MDIAMSAMQSEPVAAAMAYDGVLPETLVLLVEDLAQACRDAWVWAVSSVPR
jgi:hypothetical protein